MNPIHYVWRLVGERDYTTMALLTIAAMVAGYLLGKILEVANSCYHHRAAKKRRSDRCGTVELPRKNDERS